MSRSTAKRGVNASLPNISSSHPSTNSVETLPSIRSGRPSMCIMLHLSWFSMLSTLLLVDSWEAVLHLWLGEGADPLCC